MNMRKALPRGMTISATVCAVVSSAAFAEDSLIRGSIGLGVSYGPSFLGSHDSESGVIPIIDLEIGRYGFVNQRGVGLHNSSTLGGGTLKYGVGLGYDFDERLTKDNAVLAGLDGIEAGAVATLFADYETGRWSFDLELQKGLSDEGHEGTLVKVSGTYGAQISQRVRVSATPYVKWADEAWMDSYFTVTPAQSLTSGYTAFEAGSGFAQGGITLTASYALRPKTIVFTSLDMSTLMGDAKDSSLSFEDTQTSLSTGVMFRF